MRFTRVLFGALALALASTLFAGAASADLRQPSDKFSYLGYQPGTFAYASAQLDVPPGDFAVDKTPDKSHIKDLNARLGKITNVTPVVQIVHLPTSVVINATDIVNTIVAGVAKNSAYPNNVVLVAIGRGNDLDGNAWHWVPGVKVGAGLTQFISQPEIDAIIAKGVSKYSMQDSNKKADVFGFAAYVENSVASTIASNGGPGHSSNTGLVIVLLLLLGAAGTWYYVKKTDKPLPAFARTWR